VVLDFLSGTDRIEIWTVGFAGGLAPGPLAAGRFEANPAGQATTAETRLVYETDVGRLWWDTDGTDAVARQLVATLSGAPTLDATDIVVIA
jgi:hypothetical protein